jgi:hypothetical protein
MAIFKARMVREWRKCISYRKGTYKNVRRTVIHMYCTSTYTQNGSYTFQLRSLLRSAQANCINIMSLYKHNFKKIKSCTFSILFYFMLWDFQTKTFFGREGIFCCCTSFTTLNNIPFNLYIFLFHVMWLVNENCCHNWKRSNVCCKHKELYSLFTISDYVHCFRCYSST